MGKEQKLKRIDNPEGHQVCQVDQSHRTVAIRNKNYLTMICFRESGECVVQHQKVERPAKERSNV